MSWFQNSASVVHSEKVVRNHSRNAPSKKVLESIAERADLVTARSDELLSRGHSEKEISSSKVNAVLNAGV